MSDQTAHAPKTQTKRSIFQELELDTRLLGMIGAFILVALVFNVMTDGRFLTPRNIFNLTIQTVSVAIMATGMVFIIVTRHIDLSVGAVLATCSAFMAMTQVRWLTDVFEIGHWAIPWITIIGGLIVGAIIGAFNGWMIGYLSIPAFIVTLGGFLVWRNVGWYLTEGQTIGPLDKTYMMFGGINGTLGGPLSWVVGVIAMVATVFLIFNSRRVKAKHGFNVKPMWAEVTLAGICVAAIAGFVGILTSYGVPERVVARDPARFGCEVAEGCTPVYGLPISVLLLIAVAAVMTIIAQKTRLGRYIFATGGNPDAAELSGINTRMLTVKIFALMGVLCALAALVASARLANHTNDIGTLDELRVIAAAVIGGTALSGGLGTIYGAILGALIMQSLQSGMAMVGVDAPLQNLVVGAVLVLAVFIDIQYRKRVGAK
ncbi:sugar ABC transporter permease [Pseudooctadecabacter jejudonensis]|uniref:Xylose transport system permease protein XylH n=1 Tax=Pseudooctadecabacter jejudonensis TaxID=1391910 RepID=A0A1Y5T604_9RHOB|nr:sugar ABC transporter permease [Pseudooctadecabacter jejudonensis]SLN56572.1 Xylose transport system permease protein XylH [Pseudooctadecabacter jejudonensis]